MARDSRKSRNMLATFIVGGVGVVLIEYYVRPVVERKTKGKTR